MVSNGQMMIHICVELRLLLLTAVTMTTTKAIMVIWLNYSLMKMHAGETPVSLKRPSLEKWTFLLSFSLITLPRVLPPGAPLIRSTAQVSRFCPGGAARPAPSLTGRGWGWAFPGGWGEMGGGQTLCHSHLCQTDATCRGQLSCTGHFHYSLFFFFLIILRSLPLTAEGLLLHACPNKATISPAQLSGQISILYNPKGSILFGIYYMNIFPFIGHIIRPRR